MNKEEIREVVKGLIEDGTLQIKVDVYTSRIHQDVFGALEDVEVYCELGIKED